MNEQTERLEYAEWQRDEVVFMVSTDAAEAVLFGRFQQLLQWIPLKSQTFKTLSLQPWSYCCCRVFL